MACPEKLDPASSPCPAVRKETSRGVANLPGDGMHWHSQFVTRQTPSNHPKPLKARGSRRASSAPPDQPSG